MSSNEINGAGLPKSAANAGKNHNSVDKKKLEKDSTNAEIQKYFKEAKESSKEIEYKRLEEMEKELQKERENVQKSLEKSKFIEAHPELKKSSKDFDKMSLEELKMLNEQEEFGKKMREETIKELNKPTAPLSKKEQAKAELRRLESEYNKNYETMTSEEVIKLELEMDYIKNGLVLGKFDEE